MALFLFFLVDTYSRYLAGYPYFITIGCRGIHMQLELPQLLYTRWQKIKSVRRICKELMEIRSWNVHVMTHIGL